MSASKLIYLDANATTPVCAEALAALLPLLSDHFGNPSSSHSLSAEPAAALSLARRRIAALVGASLPDGDRVIFCSCATESIAWIFRGLVEGAATRARGGLGPAHIVAGATEHVAVLECLRWAESAPVGARVTRVDAGADGRVDAELFAAAAAASPDTVLVSLMLANNETGALNDVARAARLICAAAAAAHRPPPFIHCDASQACGKISVNLHALGVDGLTLAGHKLYAPKGVGATVLRAGATLPRPLLLGGSQEGGARAGTENVAFAAALGASAEVAQQWLTEQDGVACHTALRARLAETLTHKLKAANRNILIHGPTNPQHTLPNTLSFGVSGLRASALVRVLHDSVALSAGSACHAGDTEHASHVLASMGRGGAAAAAGGVDIFNDFARGTLRLSLARGSTEDDIDIAAQLIVDAVISLTSPV